MCNRIKGFKIRVCGEEFLTFNIYLRIKAVQKVIVNWFCTPIIFKTPVKTGFSMRIIPITIYVGRVRIVKEYFFFEKYSIKRIVKGFWYTIHITNFEISRALLLWVVRSNNKGKKIPFQINVRKKGKHLFLYIWAKHL